MAENQFTYFLFLLFFNQAYTASVYSNNNESTTQENDSKSNLKYQNVWDYCAHRESACGSNSSKVCAVKMAEGKKIYKEFANGCYLFLYDICDHPKDEYFIVSSGSCEEYLALRRDDAEDTTDPNYTLSDDGENNGTTSNSTGKSANGTDLRQGNGVLVYELDYAYDYHVCPLTCPNVYEPTCLNVNRNSGKYFKMMKFVNHCAADLYYCKNWREFQPPERDMHENIIPSLLGWTYCGAARYLMFVRYAEVVSSMSRNGWLMGDYKYSHILEPHQRVPGYG